MPQSLSRCAHCGATLPAPDAICPACDLALASPNASPDRGRYRCPNCSHRFDKPTQALWPPDVPWYRPQDPKPQCPHCQAFLKDRTEPPFSRANWLVIWALALALGQALSWVLSEWSAPPKIYQPITLAIAFALSWLWQSRRRRQARASVTAEENRYGLAERQAPRPAPHE